MEELTYQKLKRSYGRLVGIKLGLPNDKNTFRKEISDDFNNTVTEIEALLGENLFSYKVPFSANLEGYRIPHVSAEIVTYKVEQLLSFLEYGFNLGEKIHEIGSLVNAIKDQDLKDRCLDLLTASSNFDRVINQATLILEDRIRVKSGIQDKLEGVKLVNTVLNPDLSKTILKISDDRDEQQGFCDLVRGIMLAFRNPTHHKLTDKFDREAALKLCGFIDNLLFAIDNAQKI